MKESRQIVRNSSVSYIDEDGYEDPFPISISPQDNLVMRKGKIQNRRFKGKGFIWFESRFKNILINKYIGSDVYSIFPSGSKERYKLLKFATKKFKEDLIKIYGSQGNYLRKWVKVRYGVSWTKYQDILAQSRGFENQYEYQIFLSKKKGFNNYNDRLNYNARKKGFRNRADRDLENIRKRGFKGVMDYLNFMAKKRGFKDYNERQNLWIRKRSKGEKKEEKKE